MRHEKLAELPFVPRWMGMPMYPGGFPMKLDSISFGDSTYQEIYLKRCEAVSKNETPNQEEEEILKNYVIYYVHAPIWDAEELTDIDLCALSLDQLIFKCLEYGMDPL
jgi:hypothetical protein